MNKDNFLKVLQHFSGSSTEEAEAVLALKEYFPFSQILHTLSARVSKDHGFSNQQNLLQLAAVYAADRAVLKDIMTMEYSPDSSSESKVTSPYTVEAQDKERTSVTATSRDFADELINDLERLNELRHNFEAMFADTSATSLKTSIPIEDAGDGNTPVKDSIKSKKQRIIELAKAVNLVDEPTPIADPTAPKSRRRKRDEDGATIIDEIATTKEELSPESDKQKEQLQIIDHFIRTQPSISHAKDRQPNIADLATTKTGEFGENIVSETLVEILIKQGKKDKAIEVLKKLIWKFPQKKAYFAAQIEDLRK